MKSDCRRHWRRKITLWGICIEFDPYEAVKEYQNNLKTDVMKDMELERSLDELKTVAFAVGLNDS